jgi:PAS domain S-box-containing protein
VPHRAFGLALVAALLLLAGVASARPTTIRVGAMADWPPEYATKTDGTPTGFAIDVMNEVATRAQLTVRYRRYESFADMSAALERGDIDVIPNFGISSGRDRLFDFTQPIETFVISIFVRSSDRVTRKMEDLAGKQIAVVQANLAVGILEQRSDVRVREYHDVRAALYDLLAGQVDALAYPKPVLERVARDAGLAGRVRATPIDVIEVKRAMAVRHGNPELLAVLDGTVGQFIHSNDYRSVYGRWYASPPGFWTTRRVLYGSALLFLAMLVGFVWFRSRARGALDREEQARLQTESKYQTLLEHASDGVFVSDQELRILEVNRRGCEILGYAREELLGKSVSELVNPEPAGFEGDVVRLNAGETLLVEREVTHQDGGRLDVEVSARRVADDKVVGIVRDVTERKRADAAQRQSQKMEAIGRLAGGVAHDFNNILTAVSGYADLLAMRVGSDSRALRDLDEIRQATERGAALSRQLLAFSRRQTLQPEVLDLGTVATGLRRMLSRLIGEDVELGVHVETVSHVKADRGQIEQVILNLVVNARDALPNGGRIDLRLRDEVVEAQLRTPVGTLDPGHYLVLEVEDDGVGIEEKLRGRIFEPFFTTKDEHLGTGLGLATVLGIVQQSGGQIDVKSSLGRGTTFRVFLPITDELPRPERVEVKAAPAPGKTEASVLVVEDEDAVRHILVKALEQTFTSVREAPTPADALALMTGLDRLDVLVTDVVMPGMKGTELAEETARRFPELRVLFVSGYTDRALDDDMLSRGGRAFLRKPFSVAALTTAVSDLMEANGARPARPASFAE